MLLGFLSDIHAHPRRFEDALRRLDRHGVETIICLGDVVDDGPEPVETARLVRSLCDLTVRGNHDHLVLDEPMVNGPGEPAEPDPALLWLAHRPLIATIDGVELVHASVPDPLAWRYPVVSGDRSNPDPTRYVLVEEVFAAMARDVLFVGHSHVPAVFEQAPGGQVEVHEPALRERKLEAGCRYIVDVGSTSAPRMRSAATVVVYDSEQRIVQHVPLDG